MQRHWKSLLLVFGAVLVVFIIAMFSGYHFVGFAAIVGGLVAAFVTAIAWMRPRGYPKEHHPPIDSIVDDRQP